mgnify:CR=1 FL=1
MQPQTFDTAQLLALAAALGWASGLRLYAVVFFTSLAGFAGWVTLPNGLHALQQPQGTRLTVQITRCDFVEMC